MWTVLIRMHIIVVKLLLLVVKLIIVRHNIVCLKHIFFNHVYLLSDASKVCSEATGAVHTVVGGYFYLPHPYKCNKHLQCSENGNIGYDQPCSPTLQFNPGYTDNTDICIRDVSQCVEG